MERRAHCDAITCIVSCNSACGTEGEARERVVSGVDVSRCESVMHTASLSVATVASDASAFVRVRRGRLPV